MEGILQLPHRASLDDIKKQFVLKLTSRISQEAHASQITILTNRIRAQWPMHWISNFLYPIYLLAIAESLLLLY